MTRLFDHTGFQPRVAQEVNQLQIVISLVAAGLGVGLVTASTERLASQDVVYLDLVDPTPRAEFNVVWRKDNTSPLLRAFLAIVREVSQSQDQKSENTLLKEK